MDVTHVETVTRPDIQGNVEALAKHGKTKEMPRPDSEAIKEEG